MSRRLFDPGKNPLAESVLVRRLDAELAVDAIRPDPGAVDYAGRPGVGFLTGQLIPQIQSPTFVLF